MSVLDSCLKPAFDFVCDEREFTLRKGCVNVRIGEDSFDGDGRVVLQIVPKPTILMKADVRNVPPRIVMQSSFGPMEITDFHFEGLQIEGFSAGLGGSPGAETNQAVWHPSSEPIVGIGDDSTEIAKVVFHLFNFKDFKGADGTSESRNGKTVAIQTVDLHASGLNVCVKSLYESYDIQRQLKSEGGSRITHVGSIQHADESPFTGKEALDCLADLDDVLSFVNGKRSHPVCACGFNSQNDRVWEAWSSPKHDGGWTDSWFDRMHSGQLRTFFECYLKTAKVDMWKKALHESIYWYLNANDSWRGIDAGIILTQSALELLSYTYVVVEKALLSPKGFKDLWASDRLRLLFSSIGIPTSIPGECGQITDLMNDKANQLNWEDLPHALTDIRNSLVHPDKKNRDKLAVAYYDAWRSGLWCLELAILRLCGYVGTYSNRLKSRMVGQVEDVPWNRDVSAGK